MVDPRPPARPRQVTRLTAWPCCIAVPAGFEPSSEPPSERSGAGPDRRRPAAHRHALVPCWPAESGRADLAVRPSELLAKLPVLLPQPADLGVDGLEPAPQGGVGGALAGRDRRRGGCTTRDGSEPLDLGAQVLLAVEPGAGDPGRSRSEERRVGKECRSRWSP